MKPQEVIEHFETQEKAAKALGVTQQAIARWVAAGEVPELRQYQIEKVTRGKLKCSLSGFKSTSQRHYYQ